ncbi:MAG TPA: RHS repeat-associated core domain-containing protein [Longimicrobiaceae bacterium]|nr:RHS repeat-associated core domain-containing protein [Longimicrobiaceae bacterium]
MDWAYLMERGGKRFYSLTEVPGHVAGLIDSTGALVNQYRYSPFGEAEVVREQVENPLRFTAREYDAETGLYYYRARYYDPALARFISEDPIGLEGGINPYAYAGNDPVNFTDPFGLCVGVGSTGRGVHTVACPFHDRAEIPWGLQSAGAALERDWEEFAKHFQALMLAWWEGYNVAISDPLADPPPGGSFGWWIGKFSLVAGTAGTASRFGTVRSGGGTVAATSAGGRPWFAPAAGETRVSRWMSEAEFRAMRQTGTLQVGANGRTYVTAVGAPKPGGTGNIRVDFNVPSEALQRASQADWFQIFSAGRNIPINGIVRVP